MAITTFTGDLSAFFAAGTSLEARPASNWPAAKRPPEAGTTPVGSATATATSNSSGVLSLTGLADSTEYYVSDAAGARYVRISTYPERQEVLTADLTAEQDARVAGDALLIPLAQKGAASGVASLDSGVLVPVAMIPTLPQSRITSLTADLAARARIEGRSVPFVIYVDSALGSDSNTGHSRGEAFQTLAAAISAAQVAGQRAHIKLVRMDTNLNVNAPIAFVQGILIECEAPSVITGTRNFDTPNGRSVWDAVTTVGGTSVQSATAAFVAGDVNRIACIYGAGTGGGTYYGFISAVPDGTHATIPATAVARNSTTDPLGVKMSIVGDWNRVVTDAAMTAGGSAGAGVVTSATAAFTTADVGTELVIAGAGQGGQALRGAIKSVTNATTVVITANATNTVSGARCAIGVNFGDMFTWHAATGGLRNLELRDDSNVTSRIGAAIKLICDDWGSGVQNPQGDQVFDDLRWTGTGASWEHMIDVDGSWNQVVSGPGHRRVQWKGLKSFGSRRPTETFRLSSTVHHNFLGQGIVGTSPAFVGQGIMLLDPQMTAIGQRSQSDTNFANFEGVGTYYYSEGQYCNFTGGRLQATDVVSGRRVIHLSPVSDHCSVVTQNASTLTGTAADEYDQGTNNVIETQSLRRSNGKSFEGLIPTVLAFETFSRRGASNASQAVGSSGVMVLQAIWLPGGRAVSKVVLQGGGTALAWGTGWTGQHFIMGLYDPDGNLLGQTADGGGTQAFSNTFTPLSLTKDAAGNTIASVTCPRSGVHYIGLLINSGTGGSGFTYPTFGGLSNVLAQLAPALCATSGSGLTALPSTITAPPGSGAQSLEIYGGAI